MKQNIVGSALSRFGALAVLLICLASPSLGSHVNSASETESSNSGSSIQPSPAVQDGLPRIVEFRDGTILQVTIPDQEVPWKSVSRDGIITERPIQFGKVERIDMVTNPVTEQVASVRKLIAELGSANYQARVAAHKRLIEIGDQYRDVINVASSSEDSEVRWRVEDIMKNLNTSNESVKNDFDRLTVASDGQTWEGDVGTWNITASFRGQPIQLTREIVLSIYDGEIGLDFDGESSVAEIDQILEDDPALFPTNVVRLDFDTKPNGERLVPGQDVAEAYVDVGATLGTSVPNTMVSVQQYKVRKGQSAATHSPPYTGTITVRFCVPGNPRLPASVRYIGCWASYISPDGTLLQAFDARDQLIGQVQTTVTGAEFLALKSSIPIAYCKIHPLEDIDPDYAFDEFIFDPPRPLIESGDPGLYSLVLNSGERLQGLQVVSVDDQLKLLDLTIGVEELALDKSEIAVLIPPADAAVERPDDTRPFIQLRDSSILRVAHDDQEGLQLERLSSRRRPDLADVAAIWSVDAQVASIAEDELQEGAVLVTQEGFVRLDDVSLGNRWIESPSLTDANVNDYSYTNAPIVWLAVPAPRDTANGLIRTVDGENYVISDDGFSIDSWSGELIRLSWRDETFDIPMKEIRTLRLPQPE